MIRIAICDDEMYAREALQIQLEKILDERSEEIVYDFSSGTSAVRWLMKHPGEIDLLFLDVEMDGVNGMETAQQIREFDQNLLIVFVTGYADYVFDGYRVGATDYLMKPVDSVKLRALIERVRKKLNSENGDVFIVKNTEGTYRFLWRDILYFYSDRRKVILVTKQGEYPFYEKLDVIAEKLSPHFVRIHQRYLVNASKVEHISSSSVEIGDCTLPVSRGLKNSAVRILAKAMLKGDS